MTKNDQSAIIKVIEHYFQSVSRFPVSVALPYARKTGSDYLDLTGVIGISGPKKGSIYLTATRDFLEDLAEELLTPDKPESNDIEDLVGEMANIIAGSLRNSYGQDFQVSIPVVVEGQVRDIRFPPDIAPLVFPISWKSHEAYLVGGIY